MISRRAFLAGTATLLAAPLAAEAQQSATKVPRIGVLDDSSAAAAAGRIESFRNGLRDLGYIEGKNVNIDWRYAEGKQEALTPLATELVQLHPVILVSAGGAGLAALRNATTTIPLVAAGADAEPRDITPQNLAHPAGNITGVISVGAETDGKRMELLHEAVPALTLVATFWDCNSRNFAGCRIGVAEDARPKRWGFTFIPFQVWKPDDFEKAFAATVKGGAQALSLANTAMFYTHRRQLADLAAKHRLGWVAGDRAYAEVGAFMSFGANGNDLARRAARFVDRILKGAKPSELPIEQPTAFEVVINLKTAKALGLTIPPSVLARADEVIH